MDFVKKFASRFLGFDQLLGTDLVKLVYYFGLIVIAGMTAVGVLMGLARLASSVGSGVMQIVAWPAVGVVALVYWRFLCELFMVMFENRERLIEIRNKLPDYGAF